jgi:hypothetical protein
LTYFIWAYLPTSTSETRIAYENSLYETTYMISVYAIRV